MSIVRTQSHRGSSTVHEILQLGEAHCPFNTKTRGSLCSAEPKDPGLQWPTDLRPNGQEPEVLAGASAKPLLAESLPDTVFWRCWCGERWLPRVSVPSAVSSDQPSPVLRRRGSPVSSAVFLIPGFWKGDRWSRGWPSSQAVRRDKDAHKSPHEHAHTLGLGRGIENRVSPL